MSFFQVFPSPTIAKIKIKEERGWQPDKFDLKIEEGKSVSIKPKNINPDTKRLWGMNRSLINNAIIGTKNFCSCSFCHIILLEKLWNAANTLPKTNNSRFCLVTAFKMPLQANVQTLDILTLKKFTTG